MDNQKKLGFFLKYVENIERFVVKLNKNETLSKVSEKTKIKIVNAKRTKVKY